MADDMREILEDAEDINKNEPARAGNTDEPKG
jgi:hypothetical protein